jgi:hypothetical protein
MSDTERDMILDVRSHQKLTGQVVNIVREKIGETNYEAMERLPDVSARVVSDLEDMYSKAYDRDQGTDDLARGRAPRSDSGKHLAVENGIANFLEDEKRVLAEYAKASAAMEAERAEAEQVVEASDELLVAAQEKEKEEERATGKTAKHKGGTLSLSRD